jgi:hypothetical protein
MTKKSYICAQTKTYHVSTFLTMTKKIFEFFPLYQALVNPLQGFHVQAYQLEAVVIVQSPLWNSNLKKRRKEIPRKEMQLIRKFLDSTQTLN